MLGWIVYKLLNALKYNRINGYPRIEYVNDADDKRIITSNNPIFDSEKTTSECEDWVLSDKEHYYYDGIDFRKIDMIIYESIIFDEPTMTPPGITFYPSNIFIKGCDNNFIRISKKLKIVM